MGKSMSTAKQVNRSAVTKVVTNTTVQAQSNQKMVHRATPMHSLPDADYLKKTSNLDKSFNDRLKKVFVTSVNDNPIMDLSKTRSMPKDRTTPFLKTPHPQTTDERQPNKLFIDEIKVLLINHKENPEKWTIEYIAARYDISKESAGKLIENYSILQTFFSKTPSESDKYLREPEPVKKIKSDTHLDELEDIMTTGLKGKKYKTMEEVEKEYKGPWY